MNDKSVETVTQDPEIRRISLNECQALRHLRAAGWSRGELKMAFEIGKAGLSAHLDGKCNHPDVAEPKKRNPPTPDELRRYRYKEELTQKEAASRFDVVLPTWNAWEQGEKSPHPGTARELREAIENTDLPDSMPDKWRPSSRGGDPYDEEEIVAALRSVASEVDGDLTVTEYRRIRTDEMPSMSVIYDRYESWQHALECVLAEPVGGGRGE